MSHEDDDYKVQRRERYLGFTKDEHDRILKMLEDHERARWLWSTIGVVSKWIVSVGTATALLIAAVKWGIAELTKWHH